jgi:hypothetical protein
LDRFALPPVQSNAMVGVKVCSQTERNRCLVEKRRIEHPKAPRLQSMIFHSLRACIVTFKLHHAYRFDDGSFDVTIVCDGLQ